MARRSRFRVDRETASLSWSPMMQCSAREDLEEAEAGVRAEVDQIVAALREVPQGGLRRRDLAKRVGASRWGPGRLAVALRQAKAAGVVREVSWHRYDLA